MTPWKTISSESEGISDLSAWLWSSPKKLKKPRNSLYKTLCPTKYFRTKFVFVELCKSAPTESPFSNLPHDIGCLCWNYRRLLLWCKLGCYPLGWESEHRLTSPHESSTCLCSDMEAESVSGMLLKCLLYTQWWLKLIVFPANHSICSCDYAIAPFLRAINCQKPWKKVAKFLSIAVAFRNDLGTFFHILFQGFHEISPFCYCIYWFPF